MRRLGFALRGSKQIFIGGASNIRYTKEFKIRGHSELYLESKVQWNLVNDRYLQHLPQLKDRSRPSLLRRKNSFTSRFHCRGYCRSFIYSHTLLQVWYC